MAQFILDDHEMSASEIETMYHLDDNEHPDTTFLDLKKDIPVHIMYMTAWVDEDNNLHFTDDVYKRDEELSDILNKKI